VAPFDQLKVWKAMFSSQYDQSNQKSEVMTLNTITTSKKEIKILFSKECRQNSRFFSLSLFQFSQTDLNPLLLEIISNY